MSEPFRCFQCGGGGWIIIEWEDGSWHDQECPRCKGSGALALRCVGPGIPKSDDPYVPVAKGVNW